MLHLDLNELLEVLTGVYTGVFIFLMGVGLLLRYCWLMNCCIFSTLLKYPVFTSSLPKLNSFSLIWFLLPGKQTTKNLMISSLKFSASSQVLISSSFRPINFLFSVDFFFNSSASLYSLCSMMLSLETSSSFIRSFCSSITCFLSIERFLYSAISFSTFNLN